MIFYCEYKYIIPAYFDLIDFFFSIADTFEFVADEEDGKIGFHVPFHYAETIRTAVANGDFSYSYRARRLAQEVASLTTSLPLSFSSSVFIRCDENRLDLMKVSRLGLLCALDSGIVH